MAIQSECNSRPRSRLDQQFTTHKESLSPSSTCDKVAVTQQSLNYLRARHHRLQNSKSTPTAILCADRVTMKCSSSGSTRVADTPSSTSITQKESAVVSLPTSSPMTSVSAPSTSTSHLFTMQSFTIEPSEPMQQQHRRHHQHHHLHRHHHPHHLPQQQAHQSTIPQTAVEHEVNELESWCRLENYCESSSMSTESSASADVTVMSSSHCLPCTPAPTVAASSWSLSSSSSSKMITTSLCSLKSLLPSSMIRSQHLWLLILLFIFSTTLHSAESCSSRSTPKPRPPTPTTRPNITFQTYACPEAYAKWYCLNGATCFSVRIGESILYNCECADGYMGQRCEFKDLDGSYLRKASREKILVETAGIAGGVTLAVLLVVLISISACTYLRNQETPLLDDQDDDIGDDQRESSSKSLNGLRLIVPGSRGLNYGSTAMNTSSSLSSTTDCSQCIACQQSNVNQRPQSHLSPSLSPSLFTSRSFFNV